MLITNRYNLLFMLVLLIGFVTEVAGQISYKITKGLGEDEYKISLISEIDFEYPNNIVGTAQVTIKTALEDFRLGSVENLQEGVEWQFNSLVRSPDEGKEYQYISFTLASRGVAFDIKRGEELELFTFKNENGGCTGRISLVDNKEEEFMPPNSRNVNIGNQITPYGCVSMGNKNAYIGNVGLGYVSCSQTTGIELVDKTRVLEAVVSPNPANDWIELRVKTWNKKDDLEWMIWDASGRLIEHNKIEDLLINAEELKVDISAYPVGMYKVQLIQGEETATAKFVKAIEN